MNFTVVNEKPPIYDKILEHFPVDWEDGVIMTYGDKVYCKYGLTMAKIAHEMIHVKQQTEMDKDEWWDKYFTDPSFRLKQELEAYMTESQYIKSAVKDRNERWRMIRKNALDLSSPMYGSIISFQEAYKLLS